MNDADQNSIANILKSGASGPDNHGCPKCCACPHKAPKNFVKVGSYKRKCDGAVIQRYRCNDCGTGFSDATFTLEYGQRRRDISVRAFQNFCSLVSMRRSAILLSVSRGTIDRRLLYLKRVAQVSHASMQKHLAEKGMLSSDIQFDDMETFDHTKMKPVSIPLVVDSKTRLILGIDAAQMPAKGPLAAKSRQKYGPRDDKRPDAWRGALLQAKPFLATEEITVKSDMHQSYPAMIKTHLPGAKHIRYKGRKPRESGHGELKDGGFDPLFALNHTAAMNRANINRLIRETWCTTKRIDRLICHLWIYAMWHNHWILVQLTKKMTNTKHLPNS